MSRIGKNPIKIPQGVQINIDGRNVEVSGPKGKLSNSFSHLVNIEIKDDFVLVTRKDERKHTKQLHGTTRALIANMVTGVSEGYKKELRLKGVGYRAKMEGKNISLSVGFSHPVIVEPLEGVDVTLESNTHIIVSGIDKQVVGQMAALIRSQKEPEPYGGKGIMYSDEKVRRKAPKKTSAK